ncbi:MAG: energy-coupling factor transporter transmembrane component T [Syntrophomonadaceae bacterium]|nr:energy-coupling factor transporter transmembrane component T [Syntrophomonadaceae bacterium]MDD3022320.1 energy-coupling factor transporter transmembrane component T [Syntrophomonadaceae bacterium]
MLTYREKDNLIYKLHPFTIIAFIIIVFILSLLFSSPFFLLGLLLAVVSVIKAAGTLNEWKKYIKFSLTIIMLIMIINALFAQNGATILYRSPHLPLFGTLSISLESLAYGLGMSVRLLVIISVFCLYTYVVNPDKSLRLWGGLGSKSVLAITLSTRLFPLMIKDFQRISEVQRCRGAKLYSGKMWERIKNFLPIISILLISSLERALQISESMHARAYGSGPRSFYHKDLWHPRDFLILIVSAGGLLLGIWSYLKGWSAYAYYPALARYNLNEIIIAIIISISLMFPAVLNWGWMLFPSLRSRI